MSEQLLIAFVSSLTTGLIFFLISRQREGVTRKLITQLRNRVGYLERTSLVDWPIPYWVKDRNGIMLACSQSYEDVFLKPIDKSRNDYIGRNDHAIWDEFTADEFKKNDAAVVRAGNSMEFIEMIPDALGIVNPWLVIKFPVRFDNITIGVAGIALSLANIDNLRRSGGV